MIQFDFCRTLGILKRQIEDEKYFLEWGSNPQQYYLQGKNRKYFRSDFGSKKTVEFAFEINWPLGCFRLLHGWHYIPSITDHSVGFVQLNK